MSADWDEFEFIPRESDGSVDWLILEGHLMIVVMVIALAVMVFCAMAGIE